MTIDRDRKEYLLHSLEVTELILEGAVLVGDVELMIVYWNRAKRYKELLTDIHVAEVARKLGVPQ